MIPHQQLKRPWTLKGLQVTSECVEEWTVDVTRFVAVSHVINVAFEFGSVTHIFDHGVKSFSDYFTLGVECGMSGQASHWDSAEGAELCLRAREILKEPI